MADSGGGIGGGSLPEDVEAVVEEGVFSPRFCCPKCGGWSFGTTLGPGPEYEIMRYKCNSNRNGEPMSMTEEEYEVFNMTGLRPEKGRPCGWVGREFPVAHKPGQIRIHVTVEETTDPPPTDLMSLEEFEKGLLGDDHGS